MSIHRFHGPWKPVSGYGNTVNTHSVRTFARCFAMVMRTGAGPPARRSRTPRLSGLRRSTGSTTRPALRDVPRVSVPGVLGEPKAPLGRRVVLEDVPSL